jgi:nucleotide-binding universal stress UspA family protein
VLLGDDARAALNGAPCAVAVAPVGYAQRPALMGEIGVGYDGSPESEHALNVARQLAQAHRTRLSAFEAVCLPPTAFSGPPGPDDQLFDELVDAARERVAALEGVEPHAAYGAPTEELAIYSASVDLLVIGSRRHGPARRLMHGSTVRQLARAARCPLLVVERPPERAAATYVSSDEHEKAASGAL